MVIWESVCQSADLASGGNNQFLRVSLASVSFAVYKWLFNYIQTKPAQMWLVETGLQTSANVNQNTPGTKIIFFEYKSLISRYLLKEIITITAKQVKREGFTQLMWPWMSDPMTHGKRICAKKLGNLSSNDNIVQD